VLSGDRDRAGDRQSQWTVHADGAVKDGIDAAEYCASKREAVFKNLVDRLAFVDAANAHWFSMIVVHQYEFRLFGIFIRCGSPDPLIHFVGGEFHDRVFALFERLLGQILNRPLSKVPFGRSRR